MTATSQRAAYYARVSSKQQAETETIASQVEALEERIRSDGLAAVGFRDDGFSGSTLIRPALEQLRDEVAAGNIDRLYVHSPDRLSRHFAQQVVLIDEFRQAGVEVVFLNRAIGRTPEDDLLLQMQGMMAEYERAKILERSRRGKRHAARAGSISVLGGAPYGYRYVSKDRGTGDARYEIDEEKAAVVRQVFTWVALERCSIGEVRRRLNARQIPSPTGQANWNRSTIGGLLNNPAYKGQAAFGKTQAGSRGPRLRPPRGQSSSPRRALVQRPTPASERVTIAVPALVSADVFAAVAEQMEENRKRSRVSLRGARYLLQGLVVCEACQYGFYGKFAKKSSPTARASTYYRCTGSDANRFDGQALCHNKQCRADALEAAVWQDACALLADPDRIGREHERRQRGSKASRGPSEQLGKRIEKTRTCIQRLIDAYSDGLLEKSEFDPRIRESRERLARLVTEAQATAEQERDDAEFAAAFVQLETFAAQIRDGLADANWDTRRAILRTLIKKVELGKETIRIVYKVSPRPFDQGPNRGPLQDCPRGVRCSARLNLDASDKSLSEPRP